MILKVPIDAAYLQWLGEQVGWNAFMIFHRPLVRATGGYKSAELLSVLPDLGSISWLVFRVDTERRTDGLL